MRRALALLLCVALLLAGLTRFERLRCTDARCGTSSTTCCCVATSEPGTASACHCSDGTPKPPEPAPAPRGEPRADVAAAQGEDVGTPIAAPPPEAADRHARPTPGSAPRPAARSRQIELRTFLI